MTPEQRAKRELAWSQGITDDQPPTTEWYRGVADGGVGQMLEIEVRDETSATFTPDSVVLFLDDVLLFSPENHALIQGRIHEKASITWRGAITAGPHKLRAVFKSHFIEDGESNGTRRHKWARHHHRWRSTESDRACVQP